MEHRGDDGEPFLVVGIEERGCGPALLDEGELPGEVELEAEFKIRCTEGRGQGRTES